MTAVHVPQLLTVPDTLRAVWMLSHRRLEVHTDKPGPLNTDRYVLKLVENGTNRVLYSTLACSSQRVFEDVLSLVQQDLVHQLGL